MGIRHHQPHPEADAGDRPAAPGRVHLGRENAAPKDPPPETRGGSLHRRHAVPVGLRPAFGAAGRARRAGGAARRRARLRPAESQRPQRELLIRRDAGRVRAAAPRRGGDTMRFVLHAVLLLAFAGSARAQDAFRFAGAPCATPPVLHCPDKDCPSDRVINEGPVVEMRTRRTYFLDYPCDMKPGEKVTFVLALHGGGSYGNWQRNYFPLMDFKDKYRLVIAT